jgi:hypothetical protein
MVLINPTVGAFPASCSAFFNYSGLIFSIGLLLLSGRPIAAPHEIDSVIPPDGSIAPDTRPSSDPFVIHAGDMSIPNPVRLSWKLHPRDTAPSYDVYLSEDSIFDSTDLLANDIQDSALSVWNLKLGTKYLWKIVLKSTKTRVRITRVFSFHTAPFWPRMIYIDGTTNVRDIGGQRTLKGQMVRQGLFYRSAEFNQNHIISPLGISQILDLGIRCEIDLRQDIENPQAVLPPSIHYFRPQSDVGGLYPYQYGLQNYRDQYRDVFKEIAKPANFPIISHCRAGADREGTLAALLEALLECSETHMALDYQWTSLSVYGIRDSTSDSWRGTISEIKSYDTISHTVQTGAWNYLLSIGVTANELAGIRKIMLDTTDIQIPDTQTENHPQLPFTIGINTTKKYLSFFSTRTATIRRDVNRVEMISLTGRKIWEFRRENITGEHTINLPWYAGIAVLRFSK